MCFLDEAILVLLIGTALHYTTLREEHCIILHCTALHWTALRCVDLCDQLTTVR